MKKLKQIWAWLNGNKTIISLVLTGLVQTTLVKNNVSPEVYEIMTWGTGALALVSGVHHYSKGYFSTKVGNPGQEIKPKNPNVEK